MKKSKFYVESSDSIDSSQRSYKRGPYKKRPKQDAPEKPKARGPIRGPHTMEALHRDYPEVFSEVQIEGSDQVTETCYTCGFDLNRKTSIAGEKVIRCMRCKQSDIHQSCYANCRTCKDLDLI